VTFAFTTNKEATMADNKYIPTEEDAPGFIDGKPMTIEVSAMLVDECAPTLKKLGLSATHFVNMCFMRLWIVEDLPFPPMGTKPGYEYLNKIFEDNPELLGELPFFEEVAKDAEASKGKPN